MLSRIQPFAIVFVAVLLLALQARAASATEIVVTTVADAQADDAECTLREAIQAANTNTAVGGCAAGSDTDTIQFAIPGTGPHTIQLQSALPEISTPVIIDGYSQAGAQENTNPAGESINAVLMIVLDGSSQFRMQGLTFTGGDSTVRGLVLNTFDAAIVLRDQGNNKVEGNFIGTDATGTTAVGSSTGVQVESSNNVIGGSEPAARNLISGNRNGINIERDTASLNSVQGNLIGTDHTGAKALANTRGGVIVTISANRNRILDNVISGNEGWGILIESQAADNTVAGNWIGTNPSGNNLGNEMEGILARNSGPQIIGGTFTATGCCVGNVIAYNGRSGVAVSAGGNASWYKGILSNRIVANGGLGIDLGADGVTLNDPGDADGQNDSNHLQNFPVLDSAVITGSTLVISGTLNSTADTQFRLEFFANDICDDSGYGEGERYLGAFNVTTQPDGNISFTVTLTETMPNLAQNGNSITATATTTQGDTSEFSQCVQATGEDGVPYEFIFLPIARTRES